jgi:hypothetical protein
VGIVAAASARWASWTGMACAVVLVCWPVFSGAQAHAAVIHEFLAAPSERLSQGVPVTGPKGETVSLSGALNDVDSMAVDSGELYLAEGLEREGNKGMVSRIDKFDASSGAFLSQFPQVGSLSFLHQGVAVGRKAGTPEVYVGGDEYTEAGPKGVVAAFDAADNFQHAWTGAAARSRFGCFECSGTGDVAVDDSTGLSWAAGDVYVADPQNAVVDVFEPAAGGAEPAQVAAELRGPEPGVPFGDPIGVAVGRSSGVVLVVDGEGDNTGKTVDMFRPSGIVSQYEFLGKLALPEGEPIQAVTSVAIDAGNGEIYVVEQARRRVDQFNAAGEYEGSLTHTTSGLFAEPVSVAIDPSSHDVYVGDNRENSLGVPSAIDVFGPDIMIPDVSTAAATTVVSVVSGEGRIEATLNGTVNPRGQPGTSCGFVWGTSRTFGHEAPCEPEGVASGNAAVPVHTTIKGLAPGTTYFYRLQAGDRNGTNPGTESQDRALTTPGPALRGEYASDVGSTSATLNGAINPNGSPTAYFFQYGKSASYEAQAPAAPSAINAGTSEVGLEPQHVQGLAAGTVYHYRLLAVSELEVEGAIRPVTFAGPDHTFTTQGVRGGFALPDGRRWELVSPPDKHGALLLPIGNASAIQASAAGDALTYLANGPTEEHVQGYVEGVQVVSTRGPTGWSSQDISLPHGAATGFVGKGAEYPFFSEDLSRALVEPRGGFTSLAPEVFPPDSERTPYIRHNSTCAATPPTCFEPLVTGAPGYADVPAGTRFGESKITFMSGTPDLVHVVLFSTVALTTMQTGAPGGLSEWSASRPSGEELSLVSVLPHGGPAEEPVLGSGRHAVSDDGSRVVWFEEPDGDIPYLYMRDMMKAQTVRLDLPEAGCPSCGGRDDVAPLFQIASHDVSKVFFTDAQRLTSDSGAGTEKPDLYECEIVEVASGELRCRLSDLTPSSGEAADVQGQVLGASEDGTWVYFVANGVLGDGAGRGAVPGNCVEIGGIKTEGTCNLYVWHDGEVIFIAVLSGEDGSDWGVRGVSGFTARVSPDGGWLAFMSSRSLTGYDNVDANSSPADPHHDEEVFLYHAKMSASGRLESGGLVCASCNPTGARPVAVEYAQLEGGLVGGASAWNGKTWIAANVPGWTQSGSGAEGSASAFYQSRYLSDEGRLFFDSSDALVPQDVNNNEDVYEYEPAGVGDCSASSPTFSARSRGCVALISSGTAAGESAFLDTSTNGDDVFFLTAERLASQDVDTSLDVYDAHKCSAAAPCFSSSTSPPPCATADACRPALTPQVFGSPASETFSAAGNLASPSHSPMTRAQKLARTLSSCRRRYRRRDKRRVACERRARGHRAATGRSRGPAKRGGR